MNNHFYWMFLVLLMGCSSANPNRSLERTNPLSGQSFPPDALITQRAVLTARGRQFSLNGYVAKSQSQGLRLILTENFGGVLAEVVVNPAGQVFVMQAKPPFRREWVERYIAADLKCIFGQTSEPDCPVTATGSKHFRVERRWYKLDLWTVEIKPGPQPAEAFDVSRGGHL
jgi:hypothetical protein